MKKKEKSPDIRSADIWINADEESKIYAMEGTEVILTAELDPSVVPYRFEWYRDAAIIPDEEKSYIRFTADGVTAATGSGTGYHVKVFSTDGDSPHWTSDSIKVMRETFTAGEHIEPLFEPSFDEHNNRTIVYGVPEKYVKMIDYEIWGDHATGTRKNLQKILVEFVEQLEASPDPLDHVDAAYMYTLALALQRGGKMAVVSARDGYVSNYNVDVTLENVINAHSPDRIYLYKDGSMSRPRQPHFIDWWKPEPEAP